MTRSLLRRAAPALAALLVAGTLAVTGPSVSPASAAASGKPVVGECHDLTLEEAYEKTDTSAPVDCTSEHTTVVIAVGKLPKKVTWKSSEAKLGKVMARKCQPAYAEILGRSSKVRDRTAYTWFRFRPTAAQRAAGARWFRCDLLLQAGRQLGALPTDASAYIDSTPPDDDVARCLAGRYLLTTPCVNRHSYRAVKAFTMAARKFPGDKAISREVSRRCSKLAPGWLYSHTNEMLWSPAERTVVCFSRTQS